jgi:hypothetical protein
MVLSNLLMITPPPNAICSYSTEYSQERQWLWNVVTGMKYISRNLNAFST